MFGENRKEKMVRMIKEELINLGIDIQILKNNSLDDNVDYVLNGNKKMIDSIDLDLNVEDFCIFIFVSEESFENTINLITSQFENNFEKESCLPETVNVFYIFNALEEQIHFCESMDKKKLKDSIKKIYKIWSHTP